MSTQQSPSASIDQGTIGGESRAGKYLTFQLAGQDYGITILSVREIIALQDITPIPAGPSFLEGVINLRGRIIPIIDLRVRLSFSAGERNERTCIIVTEIEHEDEGVLQVGCIVDTVSEVRNIGAEEIEPPPELGAGVDMSSILGMAKFDECGKVVSLLDIQRVLNSLGGMSVPQAIGS